MWLQTASCDLSQTHGTQAALLWPQPSYCDLCQSQMTSEEGQGRWLRKEGEKEWKGWQEERKRRWEDEMTKGEGNREKNIHRWFINFIGEFFILVYQLKVTKIAGYPDNRKSGIRPYRISGLKAGIRLLEKPDIRPAGYPAKSVSGASLLVHCFPCSRLLNSDRLFAVVIDV